MPRLMVDTVRGPSTDEPAGGRDEHLLVVLYADETHRIGQRAVVESRLVVGRRPEQFCGAPFDDPQLSRRHAVLQRTSDGLTVEDQDSLNGSLVEGERVRAATIQPGAVVQFGSTFFQYALGKPFRDLDLTSRLVGVSPQLDVLRTSLAKVAPHQTIVLVQGESGVGKQVAAREIHRLSRRKGALHPVDCSAVDPCQDIQQLLAPARGGTLLLRHVDALPLPTQVDLLRWIDGLNATTDPGRRAEEPRLVVTTRKVLTAEVEADRFRDDLHARIRVWPIRIPPLRERRLDVGALLSHYMGVFGGSELRASQELVWRLVQHPWPRNVRELASVVEAACVEAGTSARRLVLSAPVRLLLAQATQGDHPLSAPPPQRIVGPIELEVTSATAPAPAQPPQSRDELVAVLRHHRHVISRVAQHYGKHRQQVYRWLDRFDIDVDGLRSSG